VRLVAVSKRKSTDAMREAYRAGQRDFGENYAQELTRKALELSDIDDLRLHMIGHLQRNKVKGVLEAASALHTVDSVRLAQELGARASSFQPPKVRWFEAASVADGRFPVFVEVNIGGEGQKSGCAPAELPDIARAIESHDALRLIGLMTVPPHTEDPAGSLPYFERLVQLRDQYGGPARFPELSLGMTHDLEQAVAAGATVVRVGTAIFGPRS
jgi:PLP dependent protein